MQTMIKLNLSFLYSVVFLQWEFHVPYETELLNLAFLNVLNSAPSYLTPQTLRQISTFVDEVTEEQSC